MKPHFSRMRTHKINPGQLYFSGTSIVYLVLVLVIMSPVRHWSMMFFVAFLMTVLEISIAKTKSSIARISVTASLVLTSVTNFGLFSTQLSLLLSLPFLLFHYRKGNWLSVIFNTSQYGLCAMIAFQVFTSFGGVEGRYIHHFTALTASILSFVAANIAIAITGMWLYLYNRPTMSLSEALKRDWFEISTSYLIEVVLSVLSGLLYQSFGVPSLIGVFVVLWVVIELYQRYFNMVAVSETDELTGLLNRRAFQKRVSNHINKRTYFSLLLIDLDHFKQVNDSVGHRDGDRILENAAKLMQEFIGGTGVVARYGGEEFCVLVTDSNASQLGEKLRVAVKEHQFVTRIPVNVTISVGVAAYPEHGSTWERIFECADTALYDAKIVRDAVRIYSELPAI